MINYGVRYSVNTLHNCIWLFIASTSLEISKSVADIFTKLFEVSYSGLITALLVTILLPTVLHLHLLSTALHAILLNISVLLLILL